MHGRQAEDVHSTRKGITRYNYMYHSYVTIVGCVIQFIPYIVGHGTEWGTFNVRLYMVQDLGK